MQKQGRAPRRPVDGVLLLDKPGGMSSNAALQAARRLFNALKAGHTGTLDPMATGLLPLTFGEATKFSQMLLDADKVYEATLRLGSETDTGDAEGRVIATAPVEWDDARLEPALAALRGEIDQIPPMHSALKRDGKPLYEYARAGIEVERAPRRVTIHVLELLHATAETLTIRVGCSKGTYIRSLAIDLGRLLGCGAHLSALRRTRIGPFAVAEACSLGDIEALPLEARDGLLAAPDALVRHLPAIELTPADGHALLQGRVVAAAAELSGLVRVYAGGRFLGLGELGPDRKLAARRLIATQGAVHMQS